MRKLTYDITKLRTVANYAKLKSVTPTTVYQWSKDGRIYIINIDGFKFVEV